MSSMLMTSSTAIATTAIALARLKSPVVYFLADTEASGGTHPAGNGMTLRAAHWIARHVSACGIGHLHAHGAMIATDVVRELGNVIVTIGREDVVPNQGAQAGQVVHRRVTQVWVRKKGTWRLSVRQAMVVPAG